MWVHGGDAKRVWCCQLVLDAEQLGCVWLPAVWGCLPLVAVQNASPNAEHLVP